MQGSCVCGAVAYQVSGPSRPVVGCHCRQCQKTSGHYVAATQAASSDITLTADTRLKWYCSSVNGETGLQMDRYIHADARADYDELPGGEAIDQTTLKI